MTEAGENTGVPTALRELARLYGVETEHRDGFDRTVRPGADTLVGVLSALGAFPDEGASPAEALRARREELEGRLLEPVTVLLVDSGFRGEVPPSPRAAILPLGPLANPGTAARVRIRTEEGRSQEVRGLVEGGERPHISLPRMPPMGCHEVEAEIGDRRSRGRLFVAPRRTFRAPASGGMAEVRDWGLFLPLHALRTGHGDEASPAVSEAGAGTLSSLGRLLRWTGGLGGSAVGTLPLLATYLDGPIEPSPYAPVSRLYWNELYLDPTRLPEWDRSSAARELAQSPGAREEAHRLDREELVDYPGTARLRHRILDELARTWWEGGGREELAHLQDRGADLKRYADFRGAAGRLGPPGPAWSDAWRTEGIPEGAVDPGVRLRHLYAQLRFPEQLEETRREGRRAGAGLYLDLPLGTHSQGFDPWSRPDLFASGASLGAPPDGFHREGQDWGLPPLRPEASRGQGHDHFRRAAGTLMGPADFLRIDHVMGLHRMYWIPRGRSARDGAYVRNPARELYALLCLESHRHRTVLVGEDLGTVPPEVRSRMDQTGIRRSWVVPFEVRPDDPEGLSPVPGGAVASLNTHDLPTFASFWRGRDLGEDPREERWRDRCREALARAAEVKGPPPRDPSPVLLGLLNHMGRSAAGLVLVSLEDLWLEERPQNRPGTTDPENWRGRSRLTLDEIRRDPRVLKALHALEENRSRPGSTTEPQEKP